MMMMINFPLKDGRSHSHPASCEYVKQMLIRLMRIELRSLNHLSLILVTIPTELTRLPTQSNTTFILAVLTVRSVVPFTNNC
jgi:hypothetical protein